MDDYHHHIFGGKMNTKSNKSATKKGLWAPIAFIATLVWVIIMGIGAGVSIIVDTLVGIAFFVIKITIILALLANRAWKKVARFFKYEWKKNYVRLTNPQPACEICNDTTDENVEFSDCCGRFVHDSCHADETFEKMFGNPANIEDLFNRMTEMK